MTTCSGEGVSYYDMTEEERAQIPERIREYSWFEAFGYAPFAITDVEHVLYAADGEHDSDNWAGVFQLKDGRFGYLSAGCDYTGWGCQAGGTGDTRTTLTEVMTELVTDDDRRRFGLEVA